MKCGPKLNKLANKLLVVHELRETPRFQEDTQYFAHLEFNDDHSRHLILDTHPSSRLNQVPDASSYKLNFATKWALSLDSQFSELLQAGQSVKILIPSKIDSSNTRAQKESIADYRLLRFRVGELLHPLFLEPPNLDSLYPFQIEGVKWLVNTLGAILADDMGLGKTVQVISAIRLLFNRAKLQSTLIVCPKGLIVTWEREFKRWAPELGVATLTPQAQIRESAWKTVIGRRHVILTNYEQFRDVPDILTRSSLDLIVADEAHRIRNRDARTTSGIHSLQPKCFWAITGTPIERDIEDLATLLSLVAPQRFTPSDAKLHPSSLRSRSRQHILRRRKQEVLKELPDVLDNTEMLELSEAQKQTYWKTMKEYQNTARKGDSLALLTKLQTLCDIDTKSGESCKVVRTISLLEQIQEQEEKVVVFSYRLEPLRELKRQVISRWGNDACVLLVGEMSNTERDHAVEKFRNDEKSFVLLASSRIASEGLTLVEANHVILFNQWWNPSANHQARDRVVRIGQQRKVRVYRFCCRGTIEESLERILESKQSLFNETVDRLIHIERNVWKRALREVGINKILSETNL